MCQKKKPQLCGIGMHSDIDKCIWFKLCIMTGTNEFCILIMILEPWPWSKWRGCWKKTPTFLHQLWRSVVYHALRLVDLISLTFIWSCPISNEGREPCDFVMWLSGLHSDSYRPFSFKLGVVIETTELNILILVWMMLIFIESHSCIKKTTNPNNLCPLFLTNFRINLNEI